MGVQQGEYNAGLIRTLVVCILTRKGSLDSILAPNCKQNDFAVLWQAGYHRILYPFQDENAIFEIDILYFKLISFAICLHLDIF